MSSKNYQSKRNFEKTTEPKTGSRKKQTKEPIFVIQKHDASNLHYDFRLEIDNSLKSWAVPKGPSTDPKVKRMAVPTEDHPIDYAWFEGVIPKDQYGGGTVMTWDRGTIHNLKKDKDGKKISLKESYEMGSVEVALHGNKLSGGYALIQMKSGKMKGNWLLTKMKDDEADARRNPVSTEPNSVESGRSLQEIENSESN